MKLVELLSEKIEMNVFRKGFEQKKDILDGEFTLVAQAGYIEYNSKVKVTKSKQFRIEAQKDGHMIGWVNFENIENSLEALDLQIDKKYRRLGIATEMYKFARELGNDIKPSSKQTGLGKEFWAKKDHSK